MVASVAEEVAVVVAEKVAADTAAVVPAEVAPAEVAPAEVVPAEVVPAAVVPYTAAAVVAAAARTPLLVPVNSAAVAYTLLVVAAHAGPAESAATT